MLLLFCPDWKFDFAPFTAYDQILIKQGFLQGSACVPVLLNAACTTATSWSIVLQLLPLSESVDKGQ